MTTNRREGGKHDGGMLEKGGNKEDFKEKKMRLPTTKK